MHKNFVFKFMTIQEISQCTWIFIKSLKQPHLSDLTPQLYTFDKKIINIETFKGQDTCNIVKKHNMIPQFISTVFGGLIK